MELHNKPVQAADSRSYEAYSDQGTGERSGERSGWPSSQGLDELSQQLVHINCRFADQSDDLSGITDDILKLQQVLNAVCESHEKSRV